MSFRHAPGRPCCDAGSSGSSGSSGSTGSGSTGSTGSSGSSGSSSGSTGPPPGDPIEVSCCPGLLLSRRLRVDWYVFGSAFVSGSGNLDYSESRGGWYWRQKVEPGACPWDLRLFMYTLFPPNPVGCHGCVSHLAAGAEDDVTVEKVLTTPGDTYCNNAGGNVGLVSCNPYFMQSAPSLGVGAIRTKCDPYVFSWIYLAVSEP